MVEDRIMLFRDPHEGGALAKFLELASADIGTGGTQPAQNILDGFIH